MESTEEKVEEYTEADGTKVIKRTIIKRIKPSSSSSSFTTIRNVIPSGPTSQSKPLDVADPKTLNEFEVAFLKQHNEYRARHNIPPLKLSRELCNYATEWAKNLASKGNLQHRPNNKYGENIFWKSSSNPSITGDEAVASWYGEIKDFDKSWYGKEPPQGAFSKTGHFTQVVWKASEKVGVGLASKGTSFFVVANYDPPGNIVGRYSPNLTPPKK